MGALLFPALRGIAHYGTELKLHPCSSCRQPLRGPSGGLAGGFIPLAASLLLNSSYAERIVAATLACIPIVYISYFKTIV